ncbi:MAG: tripartite tricarboxylate transporter permease [Angelakisella sp.]|nr:tripartite tricarboxylate transporter permease [Angelakisella sp.]
MNLLLLGIETVFAPTVLLWIILGVVLGVVFGALPGVGATMAIVLCISFTYGMDPVVAIAFLSAVYCAAITGGSITAILFKIPGTPSSAATVLDGYPMVQRGEAGKALTIALVSSGIGGLASAIIMFLLTQPLMRLALKFSSSEQFAVCFLGLSILIFLDEKRKLNTFASAIVGLWLGTIGIDWFSSVPRFTFGSSKMLDGIEALPFMLGLFAAVEIFDQIRNPDDRSAFSHEKQAKVTKLSSFKELWALKWTALRSGILGTVVGIMPGAGATIASWLAYTLEAKFSSHPELLGKGDPHGICASETANNAATGGAMVPLLAMGIPGSNAAAMMMTALAIHGVQMGPLLLKAQPAYLSATFASMVLANIAMIFISFGIAKIFAQILKIPYHILGTFIMVLALVGCYAYQGNMMDIYIMIFGGIFGYFFKKYKFNTSALILALVLGPMLEKNFRRGMEIADNNLMAFFGRPITLVVMGIFVVMYAFAIYTSIKSSKNKNSAAKA